MNEKYYMGTEVFHAYILSYLFENQLECIKPFFVPTALHVLKI